MADDGGADHGEGEDEPRLQSRRENRSLGKGEKDGSNGTKKGDPTESAPYRRVGENKDFMFFMKTTMAKLKPKDL